ncbi:MAG: coproporphyrinogen III oxidase family protein [Sulfurimonas sp.]|nr:MAG: coproporphyrinogen III oxidase family protein [Sulfurimonas sp.]
MLLYMHIPFCDSKCHYCSFNSYVDKFHLKQRYMRALHIQLQEDLQRFQVMPHSITSLFIGGGTPSTITPELYEPLFKTLHPYLCTDAEMTVEVNPNSATHSWLQGMHHLGINRMSFGVQSFHNEKLRHLGRSHNRDDAIGAITAASELGVEHISLDLIYATAFDTPTLINEDLKQAFALPIDHLSAYALTIEEGTVFQHQPDVAIEHLEQTRALFATIEQYGFTQYEISNFGTYTSRHNLGYWQHRPYLGIGAGAVGSINHQRYYPHRDIEAYLEAPCFTTLETLHSSDIKREQLFLGLRSIVGIANHLLKATEQQRARVLVDDKKLTFKQGVFYNNDYLLSDEIALFIED